MMTDDQVRELAERVLRPILEPSGYESVDAVPKSSDEGDSTLLVTVRFKQDSQADSDDAINARIALRRALQEAGDPRVPHFRYDFRGEEIPAETDPAGG